jgi:hypothetical protein
LNLPIKIYQSTTTKAGQCNSAGPALPNSKKMKHPLPAALFFCLLLNACAGKKIEEKPKMASLPALQAPVVKDLSTNKVAKTWMSQKLLNFINIRMLNGYFYFFAGDSLKNNHLYRIDSGFTNMQKAFTTQEAEPYYYPFSGSIYAFPKYKNYAFDVFNLQDSLFIKGAINNAEIIDIDKEHYYLIVKNRRPLLTGERSYSFLCHYSIWHPEHLNYYDTAVFYYANNEGNGLRIGQYTNSEVKKNYLSENGIITEIDSNKYVYYAYMGLDSVYKMDISGHIIAAARLPGNKLVPFDADRKSDIAYKRQHEAKSTINKNIVLLKNHVIVFSRLAKKELIDKDQYACTVYSKNLEPQYYDTIRQNIVPLIYGSGDDFYFFIPYLKQLIKYEIK